VHHSFYSRAPHFTTEWCYYFELEDSKIAREAIGIYATLRQSKKKASELSLDAGRPAWFLKEVPVDAIVWEYPGATEYFVVIDQTRGRIFLHDQQLKSGQPVGQSQCRCCAPPWLIINVGIR
jgi:hypothetical protein